MLIPIGFHILGIACAFALGYLVRERRSSNVLPGERINVPTIAYQSSINPNLFTYGEPTDLGPLTIAPSHNGGTQVPTHKVKNTAKDILNAMPSSKIARINMTVKPRDGAKLRF